MTAEEVDLALLRHATSKLADRRRSRRHRHARLPRRGAARHLRGHPLRGALIAPRRRAGHGHPRARRRAAWSSEKLLVDAPAGTTVEAQDLFFNTPGAAQVPQDARRPSWRRRSGCSRASRSPTRTSISGSPTTARPSSPRRARAGLRDRLGALRGFDLAARMLDVDRREGDARGDRPVVAAPARARQPRRDHAHRQRPPGARHARSCQALIDAYRPLLARDQIPGRRAPSSSCRAARWTSTSIRPRPGSAFARRASSRRRSSARCRTRSAQSRSSSPSAGLTTWGSPGRAHRRRGVRRRDGRDPMDGGSPGEPSFERAGAPQAALFRRSRRRLRRRALRRGDRPAPGHLHRGGERRRGLLHRPARGARARALRAARGRARRRARWPRRSCSSRSRSSWARARPTCSASGPRRSRGSASPSRASAAPPSLLRAVPALLKGEEPRRLIEALLDEVAAARARRAAAAAPPRALLRGLPRRDQGPRPAAARGDDAALARPRPTRRRRTSARTAGPSSAGCLSGHQAGAGAHVVSRAAAARPRGADGCRQDRGRGAARAARLADRGRSARTRARSIAAWTSAPASPPRRSSAAVPHHLIDVVDPGRALSRRPLPRRRARRHRGDQGARAPAGGGRRHRALRARAPQGPARRRRPPIPRCGRAGGLSRPSTARPLCTPGSPRWRPGRGARASPQRPASASSGPSRSTPERGAVTGTRAAARLGREPTALAPRHDRARPRARRRSTRRLAERARAHARPWDDGRGEAPARKPATTTARPRDGRHRLSAVRGGARGAA